MTGGAGGPGPSIGGHRLLSSGRSLALVTAAAEVSWWCAPDLDSSPLLWSLLDHAGATARWVGARYASTAARPAGPSTRGVVVIEGVRVTYRDGLVDLDGTLCLVRMVRSATDVRLHHRLAVGGFGEAWGTPGVKGFQLEGRSVGLATDAGSTVDGCWLDTTLLAGPSQWVGLVVTAGPAAPGVEEAVARLEEAERAVAGRLGRSRLTRHRPERAADALAVLDACTYQPTGGVGHDVAASWRLWPTWRASPRPCRKPEPPGAGGADAERPAAATGPPGTTVLAAARTCTASKTRTPPRSTCRGGGPKPAARGGPHLAWVPPGLRRNERSMSHTPRQSRAAPVTSRPRGETPVRGRVPARGPPAASAGSAGASNTTPRTWAPMVAVVARELVTVVAPTAPVVVVVPGSDVVVVVPGSRVDVVAAGSVELVPVGRDVVVAATVVLVAGNVLVVGGRVLVDGGTVVVVVGGSVVTGGSVVVVAGRVVVVAGRVVVVAGTVVVVAAVVVVVAGTVVVVEATVVVVDDEVVVVGPPAPTLPTT